MEYKTKENIYQKQNSFFNRAVSGLTGLALLASTTFSTSGCVETINGVRIRADDTSRREKLPGTGNPFGDKDKKDDDSNIGVLGWIKENPGKTAIIAGSVIAIGYGSYELYKVFDKDKDDDLPLPLQTPPFGGGNGPGGPGGN